MLLLPPNADVCPVCAVDHPDDQPHNAQSLYYQYRFFATHGRWPTWADAVAHCTPELREAWETELRRRNAWTEPDDDLPIADPPAESFHQPIGDPQSGDLRVETPGD